MSPRFYCSTKCLSAVENVESKPEEKTMAESISVGGAQVLTSSSSSSHSPLPKLNPKVRCADSCSAQLMIQNRNNFRRSALPVRFMFYREGSWKDFQNEVLDSLISGFMEGKAVMEVQVEEARYVFDFLHMLQVDLGSGKHRSIAWIDRNGKPFFPKVFLDEDFSDGMENSRNLKIEIEIRIDGHAVRGKRKIERVIMDGKDAEVTSSMKNISKQGDEVNGSKRQRLTPLNIETSKWPNAKILIQNGRKFSLLSNFFLSKIAKIDRGATVTAIHEVVLSGPREKARGEVFERHDEITRVARGASNTVYGWYAATAEGVASILTHGFGLHNVNSRFPSYEVRIHLSPVDSPQLSATQFEADNNGEKYIILCRVILENIEKLEPGPPQTRPSTVDFDIGTSDLNNPKWYVVWSTNMNKSILPLYVVSYKTSTHVPGQLGSPRCRKLALTKLLLEIKKHLPSSKLQDVDKLYGNLKVGKLDREIFIKQLRTITGDEMLMSLIQEFRSSG